jgi:hypothetical protein
VVESRTKGIFVLQAKTIDTTEFIEALKMTGGDKLKQNQLYRNYIVLDF